MHITRTILLTSMLFGAACSDDGATLHPDGAPNPADAMVDAAVAPNPCGTTPPAMDSTLAWFGTNRQDLTSWLDSAGCASARYDAAHKPVALFDFDNTISKNDFGDAITFYLIQNGKVLQPPNQDWKQTSGYMTDAAAAALTAACGTTVAAGQPLPTNTNTTCADEMVHIYTSTGTWATTPAFAGWNWRWIEPTYAWTAQLMAGYTHAEIQAMMIAAITPQLTATEGSVQTVGTITGLNGWLRFYDQTKDLIKAAKDRGYDTWIITASPQDAIAAVSTMVGINPDHVIGIRSKLDANNKLTYKFEGCGPVGDDQQQMISYIQGKRCWINKVVFGDTTATAIRRRADGHRQVFAAGDSDTDLEFLRDATYKLVINRNKKELMCHAYYNENDSWRVNPMFIQPKAAAAPYACATACKDENGATTACRDLAANLIPTQLDAAHP